MRMDALEKAILIFGTQAALAESIGIRSPSISEWKARGIVPVARCADIERATNGAVSRYDLRPDIFGAPIAKECARTDTTPAREAA